MNLLIDVGNTFVKAAIFSGNEKVYYSHLKSLSVDIIENLFIDFKGINAGILSGVREISQDMQQYLTNKLNQFIFLDHNTPIPFINTYKTKETLGRDRIALVAGAVSLFKGHNVLIIDLGTAITYDFLSENGAYLGGNIAPGMRTRFRSLNDYTGKLPLLDKRDDFMLIGNNTDDAIISGVITGISFEINGYIDYFNSKYKDLKVVLTGGDCNFFAGRLKNAIFAEEDLLFLGLNNILTYNTLTKSNE